MSFANDSPVRRLSVSSTSSKGQEDLINAYEAEEERIIALLGRKLEKLREERIGLESALEADSELHVNRLSWELNVLKMTQQPQLNGASMSPETKFGFSAPRIPSIPEPTADAMSLLDTLRGENEQLRNRLFDTERDYVRTLRLNEIYREELIEHRTRLGQPVDNLIGLSPADPVSQTIRAETARDEFSPLSSPSASVVYAPVPMTTTHSVPIPRPPSQIRRPIEFRPSGNDTPRSHSPALSMSPFPLSPTTSTNPASYLSNTTSMTSLASSSSFNLPPLPIFATPSRGLTYPSVPPPSLSSSFGSPTVSYHVPLREPSLSPTDSLRSPISSHISPDRRVVESGHHRSLSRGHSRSQWEA